VNEPNPRSFARGLSSHHHLAANHFQYSIKVLINLCVQDPNNLNPERLNELLSLLIVFVGTALKVAVPIELDSQLDLRREKIQHKGPNAVLPAKLASQELAALEPRPQHHVGIGH
jgi:hypothetical protein